MSYNTTNHAALRIGERILTVNITQCPIGGDYMAFVHEHRRLRLGEQRGNNDNPLVGKGTTIEQRHALDGMGFRPGDLPDWGMLALGFPIVPDEMLEDMADEDPDPGQFENYATKYRRIRDWVSRNIADVSHERDRWMDFVTENT